MADDATFWPWFSSPTLGSWPHREHTVVVVPIAGMADWGLGHPLDAEEAVLTPIIQAASRLLPSDRKALVLPPLRFVAGSDPSCAFPVDPSAAHALIAEVAASVAAAGFRRIALVNASPWNEELCAAAARDLRVSRGLHMFLIHLSALGLDFHPLRSTGRRRIQTLLTALYGREPDPADASAALRPAAWGSEPVTPLPPPAVGLGEAQGEASVTLAEAASHLAKLLSDIHDRAPLTATLAPA